MPSNSASINDQVVHTVRAITNAANSLSPAGTTQAGTVVSVANLTQAQQAQRLAGNLNVVTTATVIGQQPTATTATAKQLTPAQIQLFRQTALIRHQRIQVQYRIFLISRILIFNDQHVQNMHELRFINTIVS